MVELQGCFAGTFGTGGLFFHQTVILDMAFPGSRPEARPHVLQCHRGQPTTCQINGPESLCNDLTLKGSFMAIIS